MKRKNDIILVIIILAIMLLSVAIKDSIFNDCSPSKEANEYYETIKDTIDYRQAEDSLMYINIYDNEQLVKSDTIEIGDTIIVNIKVKDDEPEDLDDIYCHIRNKFVTLDWCSYLDCIQKKLNLIKHSLTILL